MDKRNRSNQFIPMTSTQAAISSALLIGFFVLWFLWAAIGNDILCWFEKHPGTGSWAQAFFGAIAIIVALVIPYISRKRAIKDKYNEDIIISKNNFDAEIRRLIKLVECLKSRKSIFEENINSEALKNIPWVDIYIGTLNVYQFSNPSVVNQYVILGNNFSNRLGHILSSFDAIYKSLISHKIDNNLILGNNGNQNGFDLISTINKNLDSVKNMIFDLSIDYSIEHHKGKDVFLMDKYLIE